MECNFKLTPCDPVFGKSVNLFLFLGGGGDGVMISGQEGRRYVASWRHSRLVLGGNAPDFALLSQGKV
jgi:hypothetical protein